MVFLKVKNRPFVVVASLIVLWLLFVNVFQRFSIAKTVENLNIELKEYSIERPDHFDSLALTLSTNLGDWDETKHRVITLLRPEHCELSYWISSRGSNSIARININVQDLNVDGITEEVSVVEAFLKRDAPSIVAEIRARELSLEQCERIGGYYGGGCRYEFSTRSIRFFTLHPAYSTQQLKNLILQCGGGDSSTKT